MCKKKPPIIIIAIIMLQKRAITYRIFIEFPRKIVKKNASNICKQIDMNNVCEENADKVNSWATGESRIRIH